MRKLNCAQKEAVCHKEGPCMVLAGPGSGKTAVITERLKYLVEEYRIPSDQILVITFTKAAAMEMQQRFQKLMKDEFLPITFGTFHAIYFHILKNTFHYSFENIITSQEKRQYLREVMEKDLPDTEQTEQILNEISFLKNSNIPIETYESISIESTKFKEIYKQYSYLMKQNQKVDFDDMVLQCYELLKSKSEVLARWQRKYAYILIDEFQDINPIQYEVVRMLAAPENNLFVVGDDDQSIYGFRGANPNILKQFQKEYPKCRNILLNINYRCSSNIVASSLQLINENKNRFTKKIQSFNEKGEEVILHGFASEEEQVENMIHLIKQYVGEPKHSYEDIAIIYRTNVGAGYLAEQLMIHQIPFQMKEKIASIYEHFLAKDIISYLQFCKNERREDFFRIMNKPKRYLSRKACGDTVISFEALIRFYQDKPFLQEKVKRLRYDLERMKSMNPYAAINYIRKGMGYDDYVSQYAKEKKISIKEWAEILHEIQSRAAKFDTIDKWLAHIEETCEKLKENTERAEVSSKGQKKAVFILTMHGSKGLEFDLVLIPDINEKNIPHNKAERVEEIEEERRLLYVAMTRAKKRLFLFYISNAKGEKSISRFLKIYCSGSSTISSCSVSSRYSEKASAAF